MKIFLTLAVLALSSAAALYYLNFFQKGNEVNTVSGKSFYDLSITALDGKTKINFKDFKGKKVLCVNTASKCGFTPQYEGLQQLQERYKDKLIIVGFPCNQFLGQESGTATEIAEFCSKNYGVTFQMTEKIHVKGKEQHPVYQWLCQKINNGKEDVTVGWNFGKFLIDENGNYVAYFPSKVTPLSTEITSKL
jgi:glutathione peroxidase